MMEFEELAVLMLLVGFLIIFLFASASWLIYRNVACKTSLFKEHGGGVMEEEIATFLEEYDTIMKNVEKILERYPIARMRGDGTKMLIVLYWWHFDTESLLRLANAIYKIAKKKSKVVKANGRIVAKVLDEEDIEMLRKAVRGLTNPEDVVRNRRRIQNDEGRYRSPDQTDAYERAEIIRKALGMFSK